VRRVALQVSQTPTTVAAAPVPITPAASDTIAASSAGSQGVYIRVITTGTATDVGVADPNSTVQGNPGTVTAQTMPATGVRHWLIPLAAFNGGTCTVTFSGARTGVTYELYRA
jgi:hypothetical protein